MTDEEVWALTYGIEDIPMGALRASRSICSRVSVLKSSVSCVIIGVTFGSSSQRSACRVRRRARAAKADTGFPVLDQEGSLARRDPLGTGERKRRELVKISYREYGRIRPCSLGCQLLQKGLELKTLPPDRLFCPKGGRWFSPRQSCPGAAFREELTVSKYKSSYSGMMTRWEKVR